MNKKAYMNQMDVALARLDGAEMNIARAKPLTLEHRERVLRILDSMRDLLGTTNVEVRVSAEQPSLIGICNVWIRRVRILGYGAAPNEHMPPGTIGDMQVIETSVDGRVINARFYPVESRGFGLVVWPKWEYVASDLPSIASCVMSNPYREGEKPPSAGPTATLVWEGVINIGPLCGDYRIRIIRITDDGKKTEQHIMEQSGGIDGLGNEFWLRVTLVGVR